MISQQEITGIAPRALSLHSRQRVWQGAAAKPREPDSEPNSKGPGDVRQDNDANPNSIPRAALLLGLAGLAPFLAGAVGLVADLPGMGDYIAAGLATYGAVILSFMGGVHWGLAMLRSGPAISGQAGHLLASTLPALIAWGALFLPDPWRLSALAAGFGALLLYDLAIVRAGNAPPWYARLRLALTSVVLACLSIALISL